MPQADTGTTSSRSSGRADYETPFARSIGDLERGRLETNLMIIGYTNDGVGKRTRSGIESNSLPDQRCKEQDDNLKMKLRTKSEK